MAIKCQKRLTSFPDNFWENISLIKLLKEFSSNKNIHIPVEYEEVFKNKNSLVIAPNGYWRYDKKDNILLILGPLNPKELFYFRDIIKTERIKLRWFDTEMKKSSSLREDYIFKKDEYREYFPTEWMCGQCPAKSSCLLSKISGKVNFKDESDKTFDLSDYSWSKEQQAFLDATKKDIFLRVNAAAGTGKTTVINEALNQKGGIFDRFKPEDITLISFTNTAAKEMTERVTSYANVLDRDIEGITISTWHSLGMDLLDQHWPKLGYDEKPTLILESKRYMQKFLIENNKAVSNANLLKLAENPQSDIQHFERVLFKNKCKEDNVVLLDDMFDVIAKAIKANIFKPKVLIVDEFQDSSYKELRLLDILSDNLEVLLTLGDVRQSIFSFRGGVKNSFDQLLNALSEKGKDIKTLAFSESFRLPRVVAATANSTLEDTGLPPIKSALDKDGNNFSYRNQDIVPLLNQLTEGTSGIIARKNRDLIKLYITSLKDRKDVSFKFGNSLMNYPLYNLLLNSIHLALEDNKEFLNYNAKNKLRFNDIESFKKFLKSYDTISRYILKEIKDFSNWSSIIDELLIIGYNPIKITNPNVKIYLLTAHGSKGMEFDNVYLLNTADYQSPNLLKDTIDLSTEEEQEITELDLFKANVDVSTTYVENAKVAFVAASRSKENLFIQKQD